MQLFRQEKSLKKLDQMQIFNVLENNNIKSLKLNNQKIFIEESFSFYALLFQAAWFIYYRAWKIAFSILAIDLALSALLNYSIINEVMFFGLKFILSITIGMFANSYYIEHLKRNNYKIKSIIVANSKEEAKLKFYTLENNNVQQR